MDESGLHVNDYEFGNGVIPDLFISEAIAASNKLSPIDAQILLLSLYETHYGFFNHIDSPNKKGKPLALVALHESEDNSKTSSIHSLISLYFSREIFKSTGIGLLDFIKLPKEYVNLLFELITKKSIEDGKVLEGIQASMK